MGGKNKKTAEASAKAIESLAAKPVPSGDTAVSVCLDKHWFGFRIVDEAGAVVKDLVMDVVLPDTTELVIDQVTEVLESDGTYRSPKTLDAAGVCTFRILQLYNLEWWPQGGSAGDYNVKQQATVGADTCALAVAEQLGFREYLSIWSRTKNKDLRAKRPNPNQLVEGDVLAAPDQQDKKVKKATDQVWTFVVKTRKPAKLRLVLVDKDDKPLKDKAWQLVTPMADSGKTGTDGLIEFKEIPVAETAATLKVTMKEPPPPLAPAPATPPVTPYPYPIEVVAADFIDETPSQGVDDLFVEWTLTVGGLSSHKSPKGVHARLHNLGFGCDVDDDDERCTRAVKAYQRHFLKQENGSGKTADIETDIRDRHDK